MVSTLILAVNNNAKESAMTSIRLFVALGLFALIRVNLRFGELLRAVRRPAGASQDSAS